MILWSKPEKKNYHTKDLRTIFDLMRIYNRKMNPTKFFLGVSSRKFLGFLLTFKGIDLDPNKIMVIQDTQPPRNIKGFRGL